MATMHTAYVHDAFEGGALGPGFKAPKWLSKACSQLSCFVRIEPNGAMSFREHDEPGVWDHLIQRSRKGCKTSYRQLLQEIDFWLEGYLFELGFSGDNDAVIMEILQSLHDKIATYEPDNGIASWLTSIVDFKVANARKTQTRNFQKIGPFLVAVKPNRRKDLQS